MTLVITVGENAMFVAVLALNMSLGIAACIYAFHILKDDFVGGTFHHSHPHESDEWWKWQPNTISNNIEIAVAIDTFGCFFVLATARLFQKGKVFSIWRHFLILLAVVSVMMIGGAGNLLLPLHIYNAHNGPCVSNDTLNEHNVTHHHHRSLMHTSDTYLDGLGDVHTYPPLNVPVFRDSELVVFDVLIVMIGLCKLYIIPNFHAYFVLLPKN